MRTGLTPEYLARKDTELANILNSLFDGVYISDCRRRILFWSKGAEEITGYTAEEAEGHWCGEELLNHVDGNGNLLCKQGCPLSTALATGIPVSAKMYPLHKSGRRIPIETHVAPIRDEHGEVIGAIEIFRDISQEEDLRVLHETCHQRLAKYVSSATVDEIMADLYGACSRTSSGADLTVLYLDVVGFTAYSESHPTDDTVAMLNEIFGMCEVITTDFNGDIEKFIGDCIMAVFIDANDAFAAARKILHDLDLLNHERQAHGKEQVAVRIGINSGQVIRGSVGTRDRKDWTIIGDVVNSAARIQELAQPNAICLSEATFARLNEPKGLRFVREVTLRGRSKPTSIYGYTPAEALTPFPRTSVRKRLPSNNVVSPPAPYPSASVGIA
ncbi:MAG: PAS domain-containing protein [Candidatus Hydrogenedentes bacterium]|nr:PAS domain-containing protein [Candidatus Hydrogenedentota bacterium]